MKHQEAGGTEAKASSHDDEVLNPPGLIITEDELGFIDTLGPLLSQSPRVLKRFANTYRLIKACVPSEGQQEFMHGGAKGAAPSQVCLALLALVTSSSDIVPELFREIHREDRRRENLFVDIVMELETRADSPPSYTQFFTWFHNSPAAFQLTPLATLRQLVPLVSRFSFRQGELARVRPAQASAET